MTMDMALIDLTESYAWVDQQLEHLYYGYDRDEEIEDHLYDEDEDKEKEKDKETFHKQRSRKFYALRQAKKSKAKK
jgi:hypothetical protein